MITDMNADLGSNYTAIKNELIEKGIAATVTTGISQCNKCVVITEMLMNGRATPVKSVDMGWILVSDDYFKTLGMPLKEGRNFQIVHADTLNVIFNEAAVKRLRLKNPLNQTITWIDTKYT